MCCPLSQVAVTLSDGTEYLCEVQINLKLMLAAKEKAHGPYEIVRKVCVRSIQHTAPNRAGVTTHALPTTACPPCTPLTTPPLLRNGTGAAPALQGIWRRRGEA